MAKTPKITSTFKHQEQRTEIAVEKWPNMTDSVMVDFDRCMMSLA